MTELGGFQDHVARVDLSSGDVAYEGIDEEDARKYIGARGLGVKYVFDQGPDVDPLSEENLLAFMNGPLTGTQVVMSGRIAICTKSPLTGTVTDSHHGGWSGARLKWAGFDGLLFEGRAEHPVYAVVEDGEVELRDASHIWGWGVHDTMEELEDEVEGSFGKNLSCMAIGQAGENEVKYACIINEDDRASGRGGTGCVMGNKRLKAVVVKSTTKMPKPANPELFREGLADVHADLVVVGLIAETPGHPATLHVGRRDAVAQFFQDGDGVGFQTERTLLAVTVVGQRLAIDGRERPGVGAVVEEAVNVLHDLVAVFGETGELSVAQ